jgi:restriction system protein
MSKTNKADKRAIRKVQKYQDTGLKVFGIGLLLLVAPAFLKSSKTLGPLAAQLSSLAYLFIFIGIGLIGLCAVLKPKDESEKEYSPNSAEKLKPARKSIARTNTNQVEVAKAEPNFFTKLVDAENIQSTKVWSKQVFADIEWRRFEAVSEAFIAQGGFKTKSKSHGPDGGVDVWMYSANADGPVSIAQCKHFRGRDQVSAEQMRAFFGVMNAEKVSRGTFITSSTYTAEAQKFANQNNIHFMDGDKFLKQILSRTPEQQKELLDIAYEGDYAVPTCVSCGIKMVERTAKGDGKKFWGCSHYPKCRRTIGYVGV